MTKTCSRGLYVPHISTEFINDDLLGSLGLVEGISADCKTCQFNLNKSSSDYTTGEFTVRHSYLRFVAAF
jgi:hypothetical protein